MMNPYAGVRGDKMVMHLFATQIISETCFITGLLSSVVSVASQMSILLFVPCTSDFRTSVHLSVHLQKVLISMKFGM